MNWLIFAFALIVSAALPTTSIGALRAGGEGKLLVSIPELTITPEKYDGESVIVTGFVSDFNGVSLLYLTREHAQMMDRSNAVQLLGVPRSVLDPFEKKNCEGEFVSVHGTFKHLRERLGHSDWAISDVEVIYVLSEFNDETGSKSTVCWGRK